VFDPQEQEIDAFTIDFLHAVRFQGERFHVDIVTRLFGAAAERHLSD